MAETATASQPMPWLKDYPAHIEWDMPLSDGTVRQLWEESVAQFADREFCDFLDKTYTYGQMDALVKKAARGLQDRGVTKGTRVGLFLPNCPYYPVFYYAVMSIGGVVVNFNPTYPTDMVKDLANLAGVEVMVSLDLEAVYPWLSQALAQRASKPWLFARLLASCLVSKACCFHWLLRGAVCH